MLCLLQKLLEGEGAIVQIAGQRTGERVHLGVDDHGIDRIFCPDLPAVSACDRCEIEIMPLNTGSSPARKCPSLYRGIVADATLIGLIFGGKIQ